MTYAMFPISVCRLFRTTLAVQSLAPSKRAVRSQAMANQGSTMPLLPSNLEKAVFKDKLIVLDGVETVHISCYTLV